MREKLVSFAEKEKDSCEEGGGTGETPRRILRQSREEWEWKQDLSQIPLYLFLPVHPLGRLRVAPRAAVFEYRFSK